MSNNLVTQQLSIPNKQMDPISNKLEVAIPKMRMGMMGGSTNSPTSQHFGMSNKQMGLGEPVANNVGLHNSALLNRQVGQMEGLHQFLMPNQEIGNMEGMLNNLGSQKILLPSKRKAVGETMFTNSLGQQLSMPNKNVAQMVPFTDNPGLQQLASSNKRPMHSKSTTPGAQNTDAPIKKMVRNESISGRSGTKQSQTPNNRTTQTEPSPRVRTESSESVRSKMRESLASALALVTLDEDKASDDGSGSQSEVAKALRKTQGNSQLAGSTSLPPDSAGHVSENCTDSLLMKESPSGDEANDGRSTSQGTFTNESLGDFDQSWKGGQEIQCDSILPNDNSFGDNFFVKDELLQGNGLTWALDLDVDMGRTIEEQIVKKPKLVKEDVVGETREQAVRSPQSLAFKIEAELFKLFGGVNKKYKEKGRSLLFNLKDHSNPELRKRVMSGEIPPYRLCSMTAEELASKELSEWRMAKAEEFAQMVVLPDSDVDVRRLVKKTHKGEFQVEFEQDDGISVEVSVGTISLTRFQSENKDKQAHSSAKADEIKEKENLSDEKRSSENQDLSYSLNIPGDGTDLIEGLMVDDFKDAEFLPPIVSLDEFMESLDAEPPFENLPVDGGKTVSPSEKESSEGGDDITPSDLASKEPANATPEKSDKVDVKYKDSDGKTKSKETPIEAKPSPVAASKADHIWEGVIQLSVSALVAVYGFFKSGEKASTKDWPGSLEIKGRVRLDAFEKFVQGLPMSRSRAVMVIHFALKEGSSENEHASFHEVVESYDSDQRPWFAEPAPGAELYLCPPSITEMLAKHLPKDHSENLNTINTGLIGIVVWRRVHLSPNSSSHHKPSSKKQQDLVSRRHQEQEKNAKNLAPKQTTLPNRAPLTKTNPQINGLDDGDDDIPPGFGPAPTRDDDDLPEFNFSRASNPSLPKPSNPIALRWSGITPICPNSSGRHVPVDQVRELIQKYGQTGNNVGNGIQPWNNNDDDDDIPEWQPQAPAQQHLLTPPPSHNFQRPMPPNLGAALTLQPPRVAIVNVQPPVNMVQGIQNVAAPAWQQNPRWVQPPGPNNLGNPHYYGVPGPRAGQTSMNWRHDGPRRK